MAAPGEAADAAPSAGSTGPNYPEINLPVLTEERAGAGDALRFYGCNRLRGERPAYCDEAPSPQAVASLSALAEEPERVPQAWLAFELQRPDPELARIRAEGCPPNDGVINNVFVPNSNPNLQGAAGMLGTLAQDSTSANGCD